ncbi:PAS domain S-box-containing protein [Methylobacterium sp. RAS18]|nr:PAS domain S-box-containing protein [Methylobacterium sp. RAS18]
MEQNLSAEPDSGIVHLKPLGDEGARLRALERYNILDTPRERQFDDVAELAADICGTPIAVVNFIGEGRQFFKAEIGLGVRETPFDTAFCRQAILQNDFLHVPDATQDPRFACNPLVTGAPGLRFYAGALLKTEEGSPIGTVCVLDTQPRQLTERQQASLRRLAHQTMAQLELRRTLREQQAEKELQERILESARDYAIIAMDGAGRITRWNAGAEQILGWCEEEMLGNSTGVFFTPEDREAGRPETEMALALKDGSAPDERWHLRKGGEQFWASGELMPLRAEDGSVQGFLKILRDRTQQRSEAAERNASELRFRSLVEVSPQVVWFGDAAGNITYCNPIWYEFTGLTPGDTSGDGWASVIHPEHRERVLKVWRHAVVTEGPYEVEIPIRRASDDQYRWFLARGKPVRNAAGVLESWIGIAIDIHERKLAEQRFEALTELSPAIIWFGNPDGSLSYLNDRWYEYTRQTREQALPLGWAEVIHPDDLPGLLEVWEDARTREVLYDTEARLRRHDGAYRWFLIRAEPLRDEGSKVIGWLGSDSDIHDRRDTEQALRETEERYRLASRATNDAIWDWDFASDHILWNEAVQTLFGYAGDEVGPSGSWWKSHIHPDDRERVKTSIYAVINGSTDHWIDEYRFLRADGSYADIFDRGYVLRDAQGKAVRMIGAMLDITERKRAEEHQRLLTDELQHRVKNTLAMVQAIASQTLRGAADIDEAREAFAARLISLGRAHDILTQASWKAAPIMEVVQGALGVHAQTGVARIRANGPNVLLGAKSALSLSLALHELATNAAKYGALSNESGVVELRWHVVHEGEAPRFCLTWSEQGGPPILVQPARRGFGSRLIERSFAAEVGGEVKLTYAPTGLVCRLEAPLASMQEQRSEIAA